MGENRLSTFDPRERASHEAQFEVLDPVGYAYGFFGEYHEPILRILGALLEELPRKGKLDGKTWFIEQRYGRPLFEFVEDKGVRSNIMMSLTDALDERVLMQGEGKK